MTNPRVHPPRRPSRASRGLDGLRRVAAGARAALRGGVRALRTAAGGAVSRSSRRAGAPAADPTASDPAAARPSPDLTGALTAGATAVAAGAAAAGLWRPGLYRDDVSVVALFRAYDAVTLTVAVPALSACLAGRRRGTPRVELLWAGMLAYLVYALATVVFGAAFSPLFLLHVAGFGMALAAFGLLMSRLDVATIGQGFVAATPARAVSALLAFLGGSLGALWTFFSIRFAVNGARPGESKLVLPLPAVRLGYVLDFLLVVPEYLASAVLLWRRAPWGYVSATVLLTSGTVLQLQYLTALPFQVRARVPGATAVDPAEPVIALAMAGAAAALFAGLRAPAGPVPAIGTSRG